MLNPHKGHMIVKLSVELLAHFFIANGIAIEVIQGLPSDAKLVRIKVKFDGNAELSFVPLTGFHSRVVTMDNLIEDVLLYFETDQVKPGYEQEANVVITNHNVAELLYFGNKD